MNALFFGTKRAFHATLRLTRVNLARRGLTAARFDLLYALRQSSRPTGQMGQSVLRRTLGVAASTVSRMLTSLEALGLVERSRSEVDRRARDVRLTPLGRRRLGLALGFFIRAGAAALALDCALGGERWYDADGYCFFEWGNLESALGRLRRAFGDSATLHYPWHPDD